MADLGAIAQFRAGNASPNASKPAYSVLGLRAPNSDDAASGSARNSSRRSQDYPSAPPLECSVFRRPEYTVSGYDCRSRRRVPRERMG